MKWLKKKWSFCLPWFQLLKKKKKKISALSSFSDWTLFFLATFVYSTAVVFLIRQSIYFALTPGACYQCLSSRDLPLDTTSITISELAATLARDLYWAGKEGGERKGVRASMLTRTFTGHNWQRNNQMLGISMQRPLVNCRWLEAYFTLLYQSLCILFFLFHWVEAMQFIGPPNPLLVGNKFLLSYISRGWHWLLAHRSGQMLACISSFSLSLGVGCRVWRLGVFLHCWHSRKGKSL